MKRSVPRAAVTGCLVVLVVLLVNGALSYLNTRRLAESDEAVSQTRAILTKIEQVLSTLKDAETGQRGFVLTGAERYLGPYDIATSDLPMVIRELRDLTGQDPEQQARIDDLERTAKAKLAELAQTVALRREVGFEAARAVVVSDHGQDLMDTIRRTAAAMAHTEEQQLKYRRSEAARLLWLSQATNAVGSIAGLVMIGMAYYLLHRDRTVELSRKNAELRLEVEERKRAEERVRAAADELQRSNRELEQFASVASHDLQEPLRKIQAFGDRLKLKFRPELGEVGQDYLDRISAAAVRMASLISDLLSYSRVSSKAQPFARVELDTIAREVLTDLESRIQQTQGRVELGPLPAVECDPLQVRQLIQNLVGNALKFHRDGVPPVVHVEGRLVDESRQPGAGLVCHLTFSDNGIGFDDVYRERIFGFFQRLHGRNEYEGTGMGLAICRRIAERHGGSITASGKLGEGSIFKVVLPATQPKETISNEQASTPDHDPDGRR